MLRQGYHIYFQRLLIEIIYFSIYSNRFTSSTAINICYHLNVFALEKKRKW